MRTQLIIALAALFTVLPAAAQTDMYDEYINPETRAIMERFEEAERHAQEAQAAEDAKRTLALVACILIGLVPLFYIGREIVKKQSWKDNPGGTAKAIGVGIAGGAVMFGLTYGVFLMKMKAGDSFNIIFALVFIAAILGGALYILKK